jgi:hypothetical protein
VKPALEAAGYSFELQDAESSPEEMSTSEEGAPAEIEGFGSGDEMEVDSGLGAMVE